MYTCKECVDLLLDFLDGSMPDEESKALQAHLSACPPCVDFLKTYRATPGLCRKALTEKMPAELANRLTDFLKTKLKP